MNPKNFLELKLYIFINIVFSTGFRIFAIPHLHRTYSDSPKLSNFPDCVSISYFASCHLACEFATMDNGRIRTLVVANVPRVLRCSRWGSFIRVDKVPKRDLRRLRPPASSAYHIDNALRLMRNNYNLFAHHSKTKKKRRGICQHVLCPLHQRRRTPLCPCSPPAEVSLSVVYPMTNAAADDDDQKARKKKAATLASFICVLQWARDSLRVGKISKSASLTAMRHFGLPSWAQSWAWKWRWRRRRSWCRWVAATTSRDGDWCSEWTKLPKQSDWQHLLLPSKRPGVAWLVSSSSDWLLF